MNNRDWFARLTLATLFLLEVLCSGRALAESPPTSKVQVADDHIDFMAGGDLVTRYHVGPSVAKPYLYPLNAPGGIPLTRAWPMEKGQPKETTDHPHQKSAWFCHGDVVPEGLALSQKVKGVEGIDFWSEFPGHGTIVCVEVAKPTTTAGFPSVSTRNEWHGPDGKKVLDETRTISLGMLDEARLLILDVDLAATEFPIVFADTKEGALGIRISDRIRGDLKVGRLENAEGKKGEKACWGQLSAWCDYSGPFDGTEAGLAILTDPRNPVPTCWHSRDYGLMAANPFGRGKSGFPAMKGRTDLVRLEKGEHLKFRFGLLLHAGDATTGGVAKKYQQFVELPR